MSVDPLSCFPSTNDYAALTDEQLIATFLDGIVRGDRPLQANKNLRVEPVFDSLQLLSNREGMVATVNLKQIPTVIEVRKGTQYFQQVHDTLFDLQYLPFQKTLGGEAYQYRYCEPPEGYQLYCTIAKELWRASWGRGFGMRVGIPLDLIIWRPADRKRIEPWQSLMGMDCDRGRLVVKMLGHSIAVEGTDLIVWAKSTITQPRARSRSVHDPYRGRRF